jgi:hypothetical protein
MRSLGSIAASLWPRAFPWGRGSVASIDPEAATGRDDPDAVSKGRLPSVAFSLVLASLVAIVAGILRFTSLDAGLRHEPHEDERVFVTEVEWMIRRQDWVPRYFEYPGLLFWILRVVFMLTSPEGPDAYLVARSVVAFFSCLSVLGVTFLGCVWFSRPAGVLAGLLLAFSPVAVHTAHMVRPDAVVHVLILASLACAVPLSGRPRHALGFGLGAAAVAIKFSAALVFPALFASALVDRLKPARLIGLAALAFLTFFALSPWTILAGLESAAGMAQQVGYHYADESDAWLPSLGRVTMAILPAALSWPGLALSAFGLLVLLRTPRGRVWVAFIALWILVFASTRVSFIRFMVPVLGVLCMAGGVGFNELLRLCPGALRVLPGVWALAALMMSMASVTQDLNEIGRPSTKDRALDWIEARPALTRVGSMSLGLGRPSNAATDIVELRAVDVSDDLMMRQFDAVILFAGTPIPQGFMEEGRLASGSSAEGEDLVIATQASRPEPTPVSVEPAMLNTSNRRQENKLIDDSLNTRWRSDETPSFIEVALPAAVPLARLELRYGRIAPSGDQVARVLVDGREVRFVRVRGSIRRQRPERELSEVLAFDSPSGSKIRVDFAGTPPFIVGELRLFVQTP